MRITSENLPTGREIIVGSSYASSVAENEMTVFLGVFNGSLFLDSILQQIQSQTIAGFPLVIVDNASTDHSWNLINSWPDEIKNRAKIIRNPINLGGVGTLVLNLPEVETRWVVTLHQDDVYLPFHLETLGHAMSQARDEEIVLFTDMGTIDLDGKIIETLIRQSWVANLSTPQSAFLANLSQQCVSYPSAAFRTEALLSLNIPWHSTTFPDTEITLLQSQFGRFRFIPEQTMLYRVNPKSESRNLNPRERILGPFASLSRVMASESFFRLCSDVEKKDQTNFSSAVLGGIEKRLGKSALSEIVKLIAAETMALAWDYSEPNSREQIMRSYEVAGESRTKTLLEELGVFYQSPKSPQALRHGDLDPLRKEELAKLLDGEAVPPSNRQSSIYQKLVLNLVGRGFPIRIRRRLVALLVRIYVLSNPKSPWNLTWKPKV